MASSLSNLVNNLFEGIRWIKCKFEHDDKKCETYGIKYKYCDCFLEYINFKDDLIQYKCLCCNKDYQQKFDERLRNNFLIYTNFLTMITISLFYCCKKMSILMNIYRWLGRIQWNIVICVLHRFEIIAPIYNTCPDL